MAQYPQKFNAAVKKTMEAAMLTLWENVPAYPAQPPDSTYRRTGTLGRTLGSGESGGKGGTPDVYEIRQLGGAWEGQFGTNLEYAPYVIGDDTQASQNSHWWRINNIVEAATDKINRLFEATAETLAKWLEGKGL